MWDAHVGATNTARQIDGTEVEVLLGERKGETEEKRQRERKRRPASLFRRAAEKRSGVGGACLLRDLCT